MIDPNLQNQIFEYLDNNDIFGYQINYILERNSNKDDNHYLCYLSSNENSDVIYQIQINNKNEFKLCRIEDWDYSIDTHLFEDLENGYQIYQMTSDTHYGIWSQINELKDDIDCTKGLQLYLSYCKQNKIDKNFMKLFHQEIDIMDLYQEQVNNYKIIASTDIASSSIVLAYNEKAPSPYVTWKTTPDRKNGYSSGHYFSTLKSVFSDYKKRAQLCLNSHISYEMANLNIKQVKDKNISL